jgi:nitrite reductase/ring-hydroxylating ferredoxin subunit
MAEHVVAREEIPEDSTYRFTARDVPADSEVEVLLVRTEGGVRAWLNYCQHWTDARLDTGSGAIHDGELRCPKHGATFEPDTGFCDFGPCEGAYLNGLDTELREGEVYLTETGYEFLHEGGVERDPAERSTNPGERLGF